MSGIATDRESAMPQAGIMPPTEPIEVVALSQHGARQGGRRPNRPAPARAKPAPAQNEDSALSANDQVLIAISEAVMRQVERDTSFEHGQAQDWDGPGGAREPVHALNVVT